jgi:hypothetical protein
LKIHFLYRAEQRVEDQREAYSQWSGSQGWPGDRRAVLSLGLTSLLFDTKNGLAMRDRWEVRVPNRGAFSAPFR